MSLKIGYIYVIIIYIKQGHRYYSGSALDCCMVNRSSDLSCTRGMILNRIHLISPGCPWPRIALQVQNRGVKHQSFIPYISKHTDILFSLKICFEETRCLQISLNRTYSHQSIRFNIGVMSPSPCARLFVSRIIR